MLDTILEQHCERDIIHEIGSPMLLQALLESVPIVPEFRQRLNNGQMLVADFKSYDLPCGAEGRFYYASVTDLVTVMATDPDESIQRAIDNANNSQKLIAFDLMACPDDDRKVKRARELAALGASLVICHTQWSEQRTGKNPTALIEQVCQQLKNSSTQVIVTGDFVPTDVKELKPYVEQNQIFALVVGSAVTRSQDPNAAIAQFLTEINKLAPCPDKTAEEFLLP